MIYLFLIILYFISEFSCDDFSLLTLKSSIQMFQNGHLENLISKLHSSTQSIQSSAECFSIVFLSSIINLICSSYFKG